ncbi:hypothetical protein [Saccharothrix longispora]|nr:hypothetical protein [Saccharothrix longispora]MDU0288980.1 hypothetical protein [Saccharothrix longispora]
MLARQVQRGDSVDLDLGDMVLDENTDPTVQPLATGTRTVD